MVTGKIHMQIPQDMYHMYDSTWNKDSVTIKGETEWGLA